MTTGARGKSFEKFNYNFNEISRRPQRNSIKEESVQELKSADESQMFAEGQNNLP